MEDEKTHKKNSFNDLDIGEIMDEKDLAPLNDEMFNDKLAEYYAIWTNACHTSRLVQSRMKFNEKVRITRQYDIVYNLDILFKIDDQIYEVVGRELYQYGIYERQIHSTIIDYATSPPILQMYGNDLLYNISTPYNNLIPIVSLPYVDLYFIIKCDCSWIRDEPVLSARYAYLTNNVRTGLCRETCTLEGIYNEFYLLRGSSKPYVSGGTIIPSI